MNKYRARKTVIDGITFDSASEAKRYGGLKLLERAGEICAIQIHPSYDLLIDGVKVGNYTPDFTYIRAGRMTVEDVKGVVTEAASLRTRVFQAIYKVQVALIGKRVSRVRRFKTKVAA